MLKIGGTAQIASNMIKFKFLKGYYINPQDLKVGIVSKRPWHAIDAYIKHLIKNHIKNI